LSRTQRNIIIALAFFLLAFGANVVNRSAFLQTRHTDAGVLFRGAWAIQSGADLYRITDDNGWTYVYPPFTALLLLPLADAPAGTPVEHQGYALPYPLSIAIFYLLSVASIFGAMHILASAVENYSNSSNLTRPPRYGKRWWALRLFPIAICAPMVGAALSRGQLTPFILLCLAAMTAAFMVKRSALAGLWLAAAICIKVYPAYLLVYPLWRRDLRCLAACGAGLIFGLLILPVIAMGPVRTISAYQDYYSLFLQPALSGVDNISERNDSWNEIFGHIQSFKSVFFRLAHPDIAQRPTVIPRIFWTSHLMLSAAITIVSLLSMGWYRRGADKGTTGDNALITLLSIGVLSTAVLPMIPASRDHYFALGTILLCGLLAASWDRNGALRLSPGLSILFGAIFTCQLAVQLPRTGLIDDLGNVIWAELILWTAGIVELIRRAHQGQLHQSSRIEEISGSAGSEFSGVTLNVMTQGASASTTER
jgi:hypothetical protein